MGLYRAHEPHQQALPALLRAVQLQGNWSVLWRQGSGIPGDHEEAQVRQQARQVDYPSTLKSGPRRSVPVLKRLIAGQRYRKDLTAAACKRASAICRSQKPLPKRKGAAK